MFVNQIFTERRPTANTPKWQVALGNSAFSLQAWLIWVLVGITICTGVSAGAAPLTLQYEILDTRYHDPKIFTQGLILDGDTITETSGLYGKSFLRQYQVLTGEFLRQVALPKTIFAEGVTRFRDRFYMLTWTSGQAFVFDAATLDQLATLTYSGEGWGITHDGHHLITSDGSATLRFRDHTTFAVQKTIQAHTVEGRWDQLNELEYAQDLIWANVWQSSKILAIEPHTGAIKAWVDLDELVRPNHKYPTQSVLNGIAYDPAQQAFWITGKWWPKRYLVRFHWPTAPAQPASPPQEANSPPS